MLLVDVTMLTGDYLPARYALYQSPLLDSCAWNRADRDAVNGDRVLRGSDNTPETYLKPAGFAISLNIDAVEQADSSQPQTWPEARLFRVVMSNVIRLRLPFAAECMRRESINRSTSRNHCEG